jgi:hypothetical protein
MQRKINLGGIMTAIIDVESEQGKHRKVRIYRNGRLVASMTLGQFKLIVEALP